MSVLEPHFSPTTQGTERLSSLPPREKGDLREGDTQTGNETGEQVSSTVLCELLLLPTVFIFSQLHDPQPWTPLLFNTSFQVSQFKFPGTERLLANLGQADLRSGVFPWSSHLES